MTLSVTPDRNQQDIEAVAPIVPVAPAVRPGGRFDVRTSRSDTLRANVQVSGHLDAESAALLEQVIDGHLRAGRRYLRVHIGGVTAIDEDALVVVAGTHDRLLAAKGTLILTGVRPDIEPVLRAAAPDSPLLLLGVTAAEHAH